MFIYDTYNTPNIVNLLLIRVKHIRSAKNVCENQNISYVSISLTARLPRLNSSAIHYDFLQYEYIKLGTHELDKIKIRISDVTGETLKVDYYEIEIRVQFKFREST